MYNQVCAHTLTQMPEAAGQKRFVFNVWLVVVGGVGVYCAGGGELDLAQLNVHHTAIARTLVISW